MLFLHVLAVYSPKVEKKERYDDNKAVIQFFLINKWKTEETENRYNTRSTTESKTSQVIKIYNETRMFCE
jgi:macrodomain Ter protein organizer (MatP/YcbG family)